MEDRYADFQVIYSFSMENKRTLLLALILTLLVLYFFSLGSGTRFGKRRAVTLYQQGLNYPIEADSTQQDSVSTTYWVDGRKTTIYGK
jgi:hypothetical protein